MPIRIYVIPRPAREYMDAHASEWTMREWAEALGVSKPSVRAHMRRLKLRTKPARSGPIGLDRADHVARVARLARLIAGEVEAVEKPEAPRRRDGPNLGRTIRTARARQGSWLGDELDSRTAVQMASRRWA